MAASPDLNILLLRNTSDNLGLRSNPVAPPERRGFFFAERNLTAG